jgi:TetR/AcrR family transcriptional regulator
MIVSVASIDQVAGASSRERILAIALRAFAERGFDGTRLADIAGGAGLSHPTLLYHFNSKEELYAAVIRAAASDWAQETEAAASTGLSGFAQVEAIVDACFHFFATHRDFLRIVRREAIEGGARLEPAMAGFARPFLERAVRFLENEVREGQLRPHDPLELMQICYGAISAFLCDARFRELLAGDDPLSAAGVRRQRDALIGLMRQALDPQAG